MNPHFLNPQQLIILFGGAVIAIGALILAVYFLQKSLGRALKSDESKPSRVRLDDEAAFTLATVNGVITQLKTDQKTMQEKLAAAERRADESARKFELLTREIDFGLMILDTEGYIAFSNPMARKILAVDTWSRRRFGELFRDIPALSGFIAACFETGTEVRRQPLEIQGWEQSKGVVEVTVLPIRGRSGATESVACVLREVAAPAPPT